MSDRAPSDPWKNRLYQSYVSSGQAGELDDLRAARARRLPHLRSLVRKLAPTEKRARVVDLGCGYGMLLEALEAEGFHDRQGVDVSEEMVEVARRLGRNDVECADLEAYVAQLEDGSVDCVFAMDVLEHFDKPTLFKLLDAIHAKLRPGGTLIGHVPNAMAIFGSVVRYGDLTHELAFTPSSVRQMLQVTGFGHVEVYEDAPVPRGIKSAARRAIWECMTAWHRLLYLAETGASGCVLTQNLLFVAKA